MDKSLHNYHYGTFIIVNTYNGYHAFYEYGVFIPKAFFLTMGSAALKVAAEIPIWEMEKWTLRFEAVSCPTPSFHVPYVIGSPKS